MGALFDEFTRMGPHYLHTRASLLQSFVELSASRGIRPPNLRAVICHGDFLHPEIHKTTENAWGVPVSHVFSSGEVGIMALQCPENKNLHVQSEHVRLEILDDGNKPCRPGQVGRVVVTALHNYRMPLIRYDTGSHAAFGEPCSCGRALPVLANQSNAQAGDSVIR